MRSQGRNVQEDGVQRRQGASIYEQTVPLAEAIPLYIKGTFKGDAYFPAFSETDWTVERREDHPRFEFVVYKRKRP